MLPCYQNKEEKFYGHISRHRKDIWLKKTTENYNNNYEDFFSKLIIEMNLFLWIKSVCFLKRELEQTSY